MDVSVGLAELSNDAPRSNTASLHPSSSFSTTTTDTESVILRILGKKQPLYWAKPGQ